MEKKKAGIKTDNLSMFNKVTYFKTTIKVTAYYNIGQWFLNSRPRPTRRNSGHEMPLTIEDRVNVCFLYAQCGYNHQRAKQMFMRRYPDRPVPSRTVIRKTVERFRTTGSVANTKRKRRRPSTNEDKVVDVLANVAVNPHISTRQLAEDHGVSRSSVGRILHRNNFHPYKMSILHELKPTDFANRVEFCAWALVQAQGDPAWTSDILFSDEALFYLNGTVNKQNYRYWADVNPHWMVGSKKMNAPRVMVWCGIWHNTIIGPYFFEDTVTGAAYLQMLETFLSDWLDELPLTKLLRLWFQQDGAPAHFALAVKAWLNRTFRNNWIGRGGPVAWPPRSPDITPLDFYFWGFIKSLVYITPPETLDVLKARITAAAHAIHPATLQKVREEWLSRLQHVIDVDGCHIENLR